LFCLWHRNKATDFWVCWWYVPSAEGTEITNVLHQDHVDNFFRLSRHSAQRICTGEKNSKCRILLRSNGWLPEVHSWVCPAAFCSQDFFLLHDNAPTHKVASVCQLLTQKNGYNSLSNIPPRCSPDLSPPDYFLFPKLKMKLKGLHFADVAEIQEAVTDELKKVKKEEFLAAFRKLYNCANPVYICQWSLFWIKEKKVCVFKF